MGGMGLRTFYFHMIDVDCAVKIKSKICTSFALSVFPNSWKDIDLFVFLPLYCSTGT